MNFENLFELVGQYQYDEIRIIGWDVTLLGKTAHLAAMMRRKDQLELCLLVQEEEKKETEKGLEKEENAVSLFQSGSNRELMKQHSNSQNWACIQRLEIDGTAFDSLGSSFGALNTCDLSTSYLMAKLADAGWRLPKDHLLLCQNWEEQPVQLMHCRFFCPSAQLPDMAQAKVTVTWHSFPVWYQIEQPVRLVTGDAGEDQDGQTKLAFSIAGQDGTAQEGICYINRVSLQDMWETEEQRFADPQFQKQMLASLSQEEFEAMKQQSLEMLGQICPRGMCFPVVEYECTLDVSLEFYTQDYLNAVPKSSSASIMYLSDQEEAAGKHGLRLRSYILESPVPPETTEVPAELFRAVQTIPEQTEQLA